MTSYGVVFAPEAEDQFAELYLYIATRASYRQRPVRRCKLGKHDQEALQRTIDALLSKAGNSRTEAR